MASTLDELNASHDEWIACVVRDAWRSDSRELELSADSSADADTDARYTGASARSTVGLPEVTLACGGRVAIVTKGETPYDDAATLRLDGEVDEELAAVLAALG